MPIRKGKNLSEKDAKKYDELMEKSAYYDRLQYVFKIKLNSLYGAMTNKYFRFFNLYHGESTTGTGRKILMHQCAQVNKLLTGEYDSRGSVVIYGDTDSVDGSTKVLLNDKYHKIQDLFNGVPHTSEKTYLEFDEPIYTPCYDENKNVVTNKLIKHIYRHKVSKPKWKITLETGESIIVTNDHSIMVKRLGKFIPVKPSEIDITTDVCIRLL